MTSILKRNLARDYGLAMSWRYAEIEFLGLPKLSDERSFRLEHIYVPLRLCRNWSNRFDNRATFHVPKALQASRHLVILGDPGSGKSTLVKVLTYAFGEADFNAYKRACGELIPIPIILRDYTTRQWRSYEDLLSEFIATLDQSIRSEITSEWLMEHLSVGKAILLIDGLDEVGTREERLRLRDEIIFPLLRKCTSCPVVLTSRVVGYEEVPFDSVPETASTQVKGGPDSVWLFSRFYVAPFDDNEIAQFITRWYQLRETSPNKRREGVESLIWALNQNDRVKRLAHNPQLLTLVALIHRVMTNLPSGRVELYDKIVEAYLETIQVYRKLGTPARLDEMKRWLAKVGWEMQQRRDEIVLRNRFISIEKLSVSRQDIRKWLSDAITKERGSSGASELADHFLDYVAKRSGLLVPNGPETFAFSHLTFQEYFAAFEMRGGVRRFKELAQECAERATKLHWHETLNLLFEMLTEFPGASDDLFDEILTRTRQGDEIQNSIAKLFSALLLDEQSGLRHAKKQQAATFALAAICSQYDQAVMKDLQSLESPQINELIRPWFSHQLHEVSEVDIGPYFFMNGDALLEDWPRKLELWLASPRYRQPSELQVAQISLIAARDEETYGRICPWSLQHLPFKLWLRRISRSYGDGGGLTLAELYRPALYSGSDNLSRGLLLCEMSIALAITKSQILRMVLAIITRALSYEQGPYDHDREQQRYLVGFSDDDLDRALRAAAIRALPRVPIRDLARDFARNLAEDGCGIVERDLAQAMRKSAESKRPLYELQLTGRLSLLAVAERALFAPHEGSKSLINELRSLQREPDHWSQLLASSALLMLGEGSPEVCRKRNELLAQGLKRTQRFTFPSEFDDETQNEDFRNQLPELLDLLFLPSRRRHWLRPDLFDRKRNFSKYFVTKPHEFFDLAMEVLEKGEPEQFEDAEN